MNPKKLPEGWEWRELGEVCDIVKSGVSPFEGPKKYVKTGNLIDDRIVGTDIVTYETRPSRANMEVKQNDVLFAKMMETSKVFLVTEKEKNYLFSTGFAVLRPKNSFLIPEYIYLYLKSHYFQEVKDQYSQGATQKAINERNLSNIKILLPPLPTQRRIVAILEKADAVRRKRRLADDKTSQILQAAFVEMFGDPVRNEMGWDTDITDNYTSIKATKGATPTTYGYKWEDEGILFLRSECITPRGISLIGSMRISQEAHDSMKRSKVYPKDILIRITGDVGISAIFPEYINEANINQHIAIIRLKENCGLDRNFLVNQLNSNAFRQHFISITRGVTHPHLSLQQIRETKIIVPPLPLQQKFATLVERFEAMRQKQASSHEKIEGMFQALLQRAFKGELVA